MKIITWFFVALLTICACGRFLIIIKNIKKYPRKKMYTGEEDTGELIITIINILVLLHYVL